MGIVTELFESCNKTIAVARCCLDSLRVKGVRGRGIPPFCVLRLPATESSMVCRRELEAGTSTLKR